MATQLSTHASVDRRSSPQTLRAMAMKSNSSGPGAHRTRPGMCARLFRMIQAGESLPIDLTGQLIYFVGPTPAKPGEVIGSAGPTTSGRMNRFMPTLLDAGLRGFVGKGYLADAVKAALIEHNGVYLGAIGGSGALLVVVHQARRKRCRVRRAAGAKRCV